MTGQEPWFIEERAFAFASLLLTSGNDVTVRRYAGRDMGIDILAEILKDGKPTMRFFGARLVGYLDLPSVEDADEHSRSRNGRDSFEADLPLCVFLIGVRKPEGLYRWVVEPGIDDGRALLRRDIEANWQTLDEAAARRLIDQVNDWYDALNGESPPKPRGRHLRTESS
jgi:hypothetical protein